MFKGCVEVIRRSFETCLSTEVVKLCLRLWHFEKCLVVVMRLF